MLAVIRRHCAHVAVELALARLLEELRALFVRLREAMSVINERRGRDAYLLLSIFEQCILLTGFLGSMGDVELAGSIGRLVPRYPVCKVQLPGRGRYL